MKKFLTFMAVTVVLVMALTVPVSGQQTVIRYLFNLFDVRPTTRPTSGHVLYGDGTYWTNVPASSLPAPASVVTNASAPFLAVANGTVSLTNAVITNLLGAPALTNAALFQPANTNLTNWAAVGTNVVVYQNGNATNLTIQGMLSAPIFTNTYVTFTNITLNATNGIKQTINLSNNVLLAASGNVAGLSRDIDLTVYASGSFSVYFPALAAGWFTYGTNTAGTPVALTNNQTMKIAINFDGTNVHYAPVPRNN